MSGNVLLATLLVGIYDNLGELHLLRALLDSGSQASFITERCQRRLGLTSMSTSMPIIGLNGMSSQSSKLTACTARPHFKETPQITFDAIIVPKICDQLPSISLSVSTWKHIENLQLADPNFHKSSRVEILLGADIFAKIFVGNKRSGNPLDPYAFQTSFGWIILGNCKSPYIGPQHSLFSSIAPPPSLDTIIRRFWEVEEVPDVQTQSSEDVQCEEHFVNNYQRTESGRFVVALPFKGPEPQFTNSREVAERRFLTLERRLIRDPALHASYKDFMRDYLETGHMEILNVSPPARNEQAKVFYIPHHCVIKPESTSTKLRVVFDASAATSTETSLNSTLLTGPKLQKDIFNLLLEFRLHRFVITADIKQMYRQILLVREHRDYQRILWRFDSNEELRDYRLNTVTYGVSSAPFLALRTLTQLAKIGQNQFPLAARALLEHTYVDDIITGTNSIEEAHRLKAELEQLLETGGFKLHKWCSNNSLIVKRSTEEAQTLSFEHDAFVKILGLQWQASTDIFSYSVQPLNRACTKRSILSELARIFDPLGFLAPITFLAKVLIQELWTLGLQWDETPPVSVTKKWARYMQELQTLSQISVPRHLLSDVYNTLQLHGFCDASESGYGAVIYFRYETARGDVHIRQVCAKSKVAPLKKITLPRLELCGALLLTKLIASVIETYQHKLRINSVFAWCDSTVALSWIKSSPHRWKCFVANRVAQIQDKVPPSNWSHVRSEHNPADCASRGMYPAELINQSLWWAGPSWLKSPENEWGVTHGNVDQPDVVLEEAKKVVLQTTIGKSSIIDEILDRQSSLSAIQRVFAYVQRYIQNLRVEPSRRKSGPLTQIEIQQSLLSIVRHVQASCFEDEIDKIRRGQPLAKPMQKLNPFIDKQNLLRVGGRLVFSKIAYDRKFPILLPQKHRLVELLIEQYHVKYFHAGHQTLLFLLHQQFWILSAKRAIKRSLTRCIRCFRVHPSSKTPLMGNLPFPRVNQLKAFSHSGIDFAGPIMLTTGKYRGTRTTKGYICLFVCMSTKAIHLELVSNLTSEAFIAAFRRFVARRGRCTNLYSDCGTNLVGANKMLLEYAKNAANNLIITWKFNPPSAPNFGGLWEAGVKAVKSQLIRVVGDQALTYEEYYTLLVQIEAILNSRPLTPTSSDPNDLSALTPGHFLVLEPLSTPPDEDTTQLKINRLSRWQLIQRCQRDFWRRYSSEYLHTLQQRAKWYQKEKGPDINSVVLIKHDNLPPLQWRLGRVVELHPGADGVIRVATVKTESGILRRPISKLCPLPLES